MACSLCERPDVLELTQESRRHMGEMERKRSVREKGERRRRGRIM